MQTGQSHIDQLDLALRSDQDVRWFDIPMNDVAAGRVRQRFCDLQRVVERSFQVEWPLALHLITEIDAFDELKNDEIQTLIFADRVNSGDIRMVESSRTLRLVAKAANRLFITLVARQDFHRHRS